MNPYSRRIGLVLGSFTLVCWGALRVFPRVLGAALLACTVTGCGITRVGPDGFPTYVHALNNRGWSAGAFQEPGVPGRAWYEGVNGLLVIATVPGSGSVITDSNDAGIFTGNIFILDPRTNTLTSSVAFVVDKDGVQNAPRRGTYTELRSINRRNVMGGRISDANRRVVPGLWRPEGIGWNIPIELQIERDALGGGVFHVGDDDSAYGYEWTADRKTLPRRWIPVGDRYIGNTMQLTDEFDQGIVYSSNDQRQAVGSVWNGTDPRVGALWDNRGLHTVRPLRGHNTLEFFDINRHGIAVGRSGVVGGPFVAIAFMGGHVYILNTWLPNDSGWDLRSARKINDANEILVDGFYQGRDQAGKVFPDPDRDPTAEEARGFLNEINQLRQDVAQIEAARSAWDPYGPRFIREDLEIAAERVGKDPLPVANLLQSIATWIRGLENSSISGYRKDYVLLKPVADRADAIAANISNATSPSYRF